MARRKRLFTILSMRMALAVFLLLAAVSLTACDAELPFDIPELPFDLPSGQNVTASPGQTDTGGGGTAGGSLPTQGGQDADDSDSEAALRPVVSTTNIRIPSTGDDQMIQAGVTLDISNISSGYFMVMYEGSSSRAVVQVESPRAQQVYVYTISTTGTWEVFPLSHGSGTYTITISEHVEGQMFAKVISTTVEAIINNQHLPFLYPNQFVNFNRSTRAVAIAAELAQGARNELDVVRRVYEFIIENIEYDHNFANQVTTGLITTYVPDLDDILRRGSGVCFDYAALMAAMLRAQLIPTRLEIGYVSGGIFHAWVSVYTAEHGWVGVAEFASGGNWTLMDPTFSAAGGTADGGDLAQFIGDGSNYNPLFVR